MYISRIRLNNFKSFVGTHEIEFIDGINFLVGENNCGKTTIFHAIEFIQGGKNKEDYITKDKEDEEVSVEVEFKGTDLVRLISDEKLNLKKYQEYIIDNGDGTCSLRIMRSSERTTVINSKGKESTLDLRNVRVYNPNSAEKGMEQYENPTGIDKTITALFDPQFVYSDLRNEDYQDFGKTKIIGRIVNSVTNEFQNEYDQYGELTSWGRLKKAHNEAFGDQGLLGRLGAIEAEITKTIVEQYGEGEVRFAFGLPEIDSFFKSGNIMLEENGITTDVSQKGTGMQRALAIALIQVYASMENKAADTAEKPILFFIDEPETFLHPKAQNNLMEALDSISDSTQVFVTTHSPYLLKCFDKSRHRIKLFHRDGISSRAADRDMLDLFDDFSPTWGEINYIAFDVPSVEFHNELYGFLQAYAVDEDEANEKEKQFDNWLEKKGVHKNNDYTREGKACIYKVTLPTLVRNIIHHPENRNNNYSSEQLSESIEIMIRLLKDIK